jgi:hypothetical protein
VAIEHDIDQTRARVDRVLEALPEDRSAGPLRQRL